MTLQHSSDNPNCGSSDTSPFVHFWRYKLPVDTNDVFAVLHYAGAPDAEPITQADVGVQNLLQEFQLAALVNPGAPGGSAPADRSIDINFGMQVKNGRLMVRRAAPF